MSSPVHSVQLYVLNGMKESIREALAAITPGLCRQAIANMRRLT